jgi:cell division protein FtsI/penicillin-binding protein 2
MSTSQMGHSSSDHEHQWRFQLLALLFSVAAFLIVAQVIRIQLGPEADEFRKIGKLYAKALHVYYPKRGSIYDRYGNMLAGSRQVYEVAVDLTLVRNPETIAVAMRNVMANHIGYDYPGYEDYVYRVASGVAITTTDYIVVADYVTKDELTQLSDWAQRYANTSYRLKKGEVAPSLRGLVYRPRLQRIYPEGDLASPILGFVNWGGSGIYGVEEAFDDLLAGAPQTYWVSVDPYQAGQLPQVTDWSDLVLTIDREVQASVERILDDALDSSGAEAGTIVVMNPENGEILAMASTPRIDLNRYWEYDEILNSSTPLNRAVSVDYEPGSVYKILTMAAALDAGAVEPDTVFVDTGQIEIGGIWIHNWNYGAWGPQTMLGCMQHSLNVCLTHVAKELGTERFYMYMQNFGIGHLTGIDIAGEAPGRLKLPGDNDWFESDLGTNSFGQGVTVTPVQMLMAISAVANDGKMVSPHILQSMITKGRQFTPARSIVGVPITEDTAHTLTQMLYESLKDESSDALVSGYSVAGKTGTAEIATPAGYTSSMTNASFAGWGPVDDPKILVYVWLEKPTTSPWGSVVASPVFREVYKEVARLTNLRPDEVQANAGD